jgi:hypothetical protein
VASFQAIKKGDEEKDLYKLVFMEYLNGVTGDKEQERSSRINVYNMQYIA